MIAEGLGETVQRPQQFSQRHTVGQPVFFDDLDQRLDMGAVGIPRIRRSFHKASIQGQRAGGQERDAARRVA